MDFAKLGNIDAETTITNAFAVVKLGSICEIHPWSKNILTSDSNAFSCFVNAICVCATMPCKNPSQLSHLSYNNANFVSKGKKFKLLTFSRLKMP